MRITTEAAEAYVRAYYAECEGTTLKDIAADLMSDDDGDYVEVLARISWCGNTSVDGWRVWIEGGVVYGEC